MRSIRRILVAVKDPGLRATPPAVQKGMQLARALGARLELFHALTAPVYAEAFIYGDRSFDQFAGDLQQQAVKRLQALAGRLKAHGRRGAVPISVAAEWDFPAYEAIIRRAHSTQADLIVADRHAGVHIAPSLLHLNDWELLRLSPVPVLLVKSTGVYDRPVVLAAVDPTHGREKPPRLDGAIVALSAAVSDALRGRLHAVHAYLPVPGGNRPTHALDPDTAAHINSQTASAARTRFDRALGKLNIPRSRRLLISLPPIEAIEQAVTSIRCDIVVMGAVSRSGLRRLVIGNTAESVLDRLACDLLIVKPTGFKAAIARRPTGARLVPVLALSP